MRIDALNKVSQLYQNNSTKKTEKSNNSGKSDTVQISNAGKEFQTVRQAVSASPDIREDRVNAIKQEMASGTYNIRAEDVADKLLGLF